MRKLHYNFYNGLAGAPSHSAGVRSHLVTSELHAPITLLGFETALSLRILGSLLNSLTASFWFWRLCRGEVSKSHNTQDAHIWVDDG